MKATYWRLIPLVLFAMLVMFFWRGLSLDPQHLPSVQLGKSLPVFELPALGDGSETLMSKRLRGHVVLLNVWASWCRACSEEQVFLMELARQGVLIYGLNYKDTLNNARQWLAEWGNPYQAIGSDLNGLVAIDLGVYGAPETFLIDKAGVIRYRHAGIMTPDVWAKEFLPKMIELEKMR